MTTQNKRTHKEEAEHYGLLRRSRTLQYSGETQRYWMVSLRRQSASLSRQFYDHIYGAEQGALQMALAFREAALRIIPPTDQTPTLPAPSHQQHFRHPGREPATLGQWQPRLGGHTLHGPNRSYTRTFSINRYGDEQAKEMARQARSELLKAYAPDAFFIHREPAQQHALNQFDAILKANDSPNYEVPSADRPESMGLDAATMQRRIQALQSWFDQMRPSLVHACLKVVSVTVSRKPPERIKNKIWVVVGDGSKEQRKTFSLYLGNKTFEQQLPVAWTRLQSILAMQHSPQIAQEFSQHYQAQFMASTAATGFQVRWRYLHIDPQVRRNPPQEIASLLEGFEVPEETSCFNFLSSTQQHARQNPPENKTDPSPRRTTAAPLRGINSRHSHPDREE